MQHLSEIHSDVWVFFGIALGVPLNVIKSIQSYYPDARVQQWMTELIWYWLMESPYITAIDCWKKVVAALEQVDMLALASKIKQKCLWKSEGMSVCVSIVAVCLTACIYTVAYVMHQLAVDCAVLLAIAVSSF